MESSLEGILALRDVSTHERQERKRPSSPLYLSDISSLDSKRPRLGLNDDDDSSRESRWSQYRDCTNLSTLTEASETQPEVLPTYSTFPIQHVIIAAPQVPDLEKHIDNLTVQLEAWSLVSLKEWRQKQDEDTMQDDVSSTPSSRTRQRQKAAKRKLMRTLRRNHEKQSMQEE
jgi:hypothetical protein